MNEPLISIITINYNNKTGLIKTIDSVLGQSFKNYEYLIIDGLSNDGSKEVILQYQSNFAYWVSENDNGVYDAMNKGIKNANGKYVYFLNSGDCFCSDTVLKGVSTAMLSNDPAVVYGNVIIGNKTIRYKKQLSLYYLLNMGMCHQAQFLKRELFEKHGYYDPTYKITADHCQLMLFIAKYNAAYLQVNIAIAVIELGGISGASIENNRKERLMFMQKEFPLLAEDYIKLRKYNKLNIFERTKNFISRKISVK